MRNRVAVLFARLGPYHFARLKAAAARLPVTAVEYSTVDATYAWDKIEGAEGFDRVTLFADVALENQSAQKIRNRLSEVLSQIAPQAVIIPGWFDRCSLAALRWCRANRVPAVVMSESTAWDDERRWWKEALKRRVIGLFSTALVGGSAHADYLVQLGMKRERIFRGYDAVDNDYFAAKAAEVRSRKSEVRSQYGLPEKFFLASARFVQQKNLLKLIEAYALYRKNAEKRKAEILKSEITSPQPSAHSGEGVELWDLVLLGDGPLRPSILDLRSSLRLDSSVHLPGFKQYHELPTYYALASAFVHPSTIEPWGLVVNEAAASGLPVLVSNRCGCASELVRDGENGFTFDPENVEEMADSMSKLAGMKAELAEFGTASRRIVSNFGADAFGAGLANAVSAATEGSASRTGSLDQWLLSALAAR